MQAGKPFFTAALWLALHFCLNPTHASTIIWTGAGDGVSWNNANNWSNSIPPAATDDAVISGEGTNLIITISSNVTVQSVQCSASLSVSGGNLSLTKSASQVAGEFIIAPDQSLNVSGSNTTFVANGPAIVDAANFAVSAGASVSLPGVQNYLKDCSSPNWTVTGSNSVLSLPGLTNLTGVACSFPTIQATAGGQILVTNLASITVGPLTILADGTNSLVDLRGLTNSAGESGYLLSFVAQNGGTVWLPQLTGGPLVSVTLNPGGVMPTVQFRQLDGITLNGVTANFNNLTTLAGQTFISGVTMSFPALTNLDGGNLAVSGGAMVTLPAVQNYVKDCSSPNWTVTGSNSVLSLPGLTNLTGGTCSFPTIEATAGGQILATNLASITVGPLTILAEGTGSLITLSGLRTGAGENGYALSFVAQNQGTITIPLCGVVNLVSVTAQSGGLINMSLVQGISGASCAITATGAGSVIDLSSLSGFATPLGVSSLTATNGGTILLNNDVFLLENVAVNWAGSSVLPTVTTATNKLSLYGHPWHSYRVEVLDTRSLSNTWQFYTRVPLTNAVQVIGNVPQVWQSFRVFEFVASPPIVDLNIVGPQLGQIVLYAMTNQTSRVETTTNISSPVTWQPWSANILMTNSFRIFAPASLALPAQFFRGDQL